MAKITKTLGPIHFEDLEPHRFEDLVRELIYDFKDWQDIEATGRGGSDDGFDVRAWEKNKQTEDINNEDQDQEEKNVNPMTGNLWMIQCKREKEIGPKKVADIIKKYIDKKNPPYGYILVASTDFSKKSYDTFRNELRKLGVMEFHLWGKAALEDMLHMPKNDRLLFAFFGISIVMRQRSKSTEVRFSMNNKNKLIRVLGGGNNNKDIYEPVLIRDIEDSNYPYKEQYKDFDKNQRWREHPAISLYPLGLIFNVRKFYAYVDLDKKEYDFIETIDLVNRQSEADDKKSKKDYYKNQNLARDYWEHIPYRNRIYFEIMGMILYKDMMVIDEKGDIFHDFPHIFCNYQYNNSPFKRFWEYLMPDTKNYYIDINKESYKKINYFPKKLPEIKEGNIYKDRFLEPAESVARMLRYDNVKEIYFADRKYDFLNPRDKILVKGTEIESSYERDSVEMSGVEIIYKYKGTTLELTRNKEEYFRTNIENQIGRKLNDNEVITVFEVKKAESWQFPKTEETK